MSYQHFVDSSKECVMRSWICGEDGYVTLAWPFRLTLVELQFVKDIVNHQLDGFIRHAQKASDGDIEYASWFAARTQGDAS